MKHKDSENLLSTQENLSGSSEPIITSHGSAATTRYTPDSGRKITFDNLDYHQDVHHMSEEHQNIDKHFITPMSTENRVHGNHLSDQIPSTGLKEMENGKCLPSLKDHERQREKYIHLVARIMAANIPCLNFLLNVSEVPIPHFYTKELKHVTETVSNALL